MSTQRIIYIAGPMTGKPEWNFPEFDRVAEELRAQGHIVVNPCDFDRARGFDPKTATGFPNKDLREAMVAEFAGLNRLTYSSRRWPYRGNYGTHDRDVCEGYGLADCTDLMLLDGWEHSRGAFAEATVALWLGIKVWTEGNLDSPAGWHLLTIDDLIDCRSYLLKFADGIPEMSANSTPEPNQSVIKEAQEIVEQRENQHGTFEDCLEDISKTWSILLDNEVTGAQVALCMAALKLVRGKQEYNRDNALDLCGYAEGWDRWESKYGAGNAK